jgi:hypothetical protein
VTLACDDLQIQTHKLIISSCSQLLRNILNTLSQFYLNQLLPICLVIIGLYDRQIVCLALFDIEYLSVKFV